MTTIIAILFVIAVVFVLPLLWLFAEMKRTPLSTKPWKPGEE